MMAIRARQIAAERVRSFVIGPEIAHSGDSEPVQDALDLGTTIALLDWLKSRLDRVRGRGEPT
jgi:hypothetical protein